MEDNLLKYIEENRGDLDLNAPDERNWAAIQERIAPPQKKQFKGIKLIAGLAAVLVVGLIAINYTSSRQETKELSLETYSGYEAEGEEKIGNGGGRTNNVQWTPNPNVQYKYNITNSATNEVYLNVGDSYGVNYSYCIDVAANSPAPASVFKGNGLGWQSNYGAIDREDYRNRETFDVDRYYEQYDNFNENEFESPLEKPMSTFGLDADGASYSNVRRFIMGGYLPPKNAVKIEEMVNYFDYDLPEPDAGKPFSVTTELAYCPWNKEHQLMQVALNGKSIQMDEKQANNLVFLIDVSGSMGSADKLPLLKKSLYLVVNEMQADDRIAIVVYAGASGLVLPSTSGANKSRILDAIENLESGGSTNGEAGIQLAYSTAVENYISDGNNRVILATDGDFNVGTSGDAELVRLIEQKRETGVYLSVLGFGTGNLQSSKMEKLAQNGNGNYFYIDNLMEAKKVLVNEIGGTLVTIANDVKFQIEFNPECVKNYRLLGYENRILETRDFDDDKKDAGDLGAGHSVIAFFEIEPNDSLELQTGQNLRYQNSRSLTSSKITEELAEVKLRYKKPGSKSSKLLRYTVGREAELKVSDNMGFASAVAEFALLIRESDYRGEASFENILKRAEKHLGADVHGYRKEFIQMVKIASELQKEYYVKLGKD